MHKKTVMEMGCKLENAIEHGACETTTSKREPPILVHFYGFWQQLVANSLKCRTAGHTDTRNSQNMVVRNVTQTRKRYKTRGMRVQKKEARATYFGSFLWIWPPIGRKQLEMQDGGPH